MAQVTVTVPDSVAQELGQDVLERTVLEAVAIMGYREALLTLGEVGALLGLNYAQTEAFLSARGVPLGYDARALEADRQANLKLLG